MVRSCQTMGDYLGSCRKVEDSYLTSCQELEDSYLRNCQELEDSYLELLGSWESFTVGAVRS